MKKTIIGFVVHAALILIPNISTASTLHWLSQVEAEQQAIANHESSEPRISANGRYVTFNSIASNLIENDHNQAKDVFWHDLQTGTTKLVTSTSTGEQLTNIFIRYSAPTSDGIYVAFASSSSNLPSVAGTNLFVKNMVTGEVVNHSDYGNNQIFSIESTPFLSDDAQFVTFVSGTSMDPRDDGNRSQVYRKNLLTDSIELLSVTFDGTADYNDYIEIMDVSPNSRYVLMASEATNVVEQTINNNGDNLFLKDTQTGTTTLVTVKPDGSPSSCDMYIYRGSVSNAGTVVFTEDCDDLVNGDTNSLSDVFYFDGTSNTRLNLNSNGNQVFDAGSREVVISGDGSKVVFNSSSAELVSGVDAEDMLFVYEVQNNTTSLLTRNSNNEVANRGSYPFTSQPSMSLSLDGSVVTFTSRATNLSNSPINPNDFEILAHQFGSGTFRQVTQPAFVPDTIVDDILFASMSSDQMSVVYTSTAINLTNDTDPNDPTLPKNQLYLLDRHTNENQLIGSEPVYIDISASGRYVVFTSEVNQPNGLLDLGAQNIFLYDRANNTYTLIDEGTRPKVNNSGKVVFSSKKSIASNDNNTGSDIYFYDPDNGSITLVSENLSNTAAGDSFRPDIGGPDNELWITFSSLSDDLVLNDTNERYDIFLKSIQTGNITRISQTAAGLEADDNSFGPAISENGQFVVFFTDATNLGRQLNSEEQIMLYDRNSQLLEIVSKNSDGNLVADRITAFYPKISDTGRFISYIYNDSWSTNPITGDDDQNDDVVVYDRLTENVRIASVTREGLQVDDSVNPSTSEITEDVSTSPPLVGVLFLARSPDDLTGIPHHPGHQEAFLFQQGGPDVSLNIQIVGLGQVSGTSGINCTETCNYDFSLGTDLTLLATAGPDHTFTGWQVEFGGCEEEAQNPCDVHMNRSKTLVANFVNQNDVIFANGFE